MQNDPTLSSNQDSIASEKHITEKYLISSEGVTSNIYREKWSDGTTTVSKVSKAPQDVPLLRTEYSNLSKLQNSSIPEIPTVYSEDITNLKTLMMYSFRLEDLSNYRTLEEGSSLNKPIVETLDTFQKVMIVSAISRALEYANRNNIIHGDVQLRNIMISTTTPEASPKVKLIDWGMSAPIRKIYNDMDDVVLTARTMHFLFPEGMPLLLRNWTLMVEEKRFYTDPKDAWSDLTEVITKYVTEVYSSLY